MSTSLFYFMKYQMVGSSLGDFSYKILNVLHDFYLHVWR
jgi:hypothetical protein